MKNYVMISEYLADYAYEFYGSMSSDLQFDLSIASNYFVGVLPYVQLGFYALFVYVFVKFFVWFFKLY